MSTFTLHPDNYLTVRESEVALLVSRGLKNRAIADELGTSEQVIKNLCRRIYDKVGVNTRMELALLLLSDEWIQNEAQRDPAQGERWATNKVMLQMQAVLGG